MSSIKSKSLLETGGRRNMPAQSIGERGLLASPNKTTDSTLDLLRRLGLHGMAAGFKDLEERSRIPDVRYTQWLALLLEREKELREKRRFERRSRSAKLGHAASMEDAERLAACGLESAVFHELATGAWIRAKKNLLVVGCPGVGKTWLACALGRQALVDGYSVAYHRAPRLFESLALARIEGKYNRMLRSIARLDLLILDDLGPERLDVRERRDLLEIVEDRYESHSTIVISQLPVERWYGVIGDPAIAISVFDRLVHNSHRVALKGESLRKPRRSEQD